MPALIINILITALVYRGIRESRNASNAMVVIKIAVVILVICLGSAYVTAANWQPFMPNGIAGVLAGVSAVFFAYIGFDAISTTAEECHNPQRDLPRGMMYSIIICTVLYILISLVLTGMVSYKDLNVEDPLVYVFSQAGLDWISGIIAVSAVVAMASVMLCFSAGTTAHLDEHESRRIVTGKILQRASAIWHTRLCHHSYRAPGRNSNILH